jgi:hypothetical protein
LKLNAEQRKHLAASFQTIALGQLAYFGYRSVELRYYGWFVAAGALAIILELVALFVLRDREIGSHDESIHRDGYLGRDVSFGRQSYPDFRLAR